ncbi:MAG: hypothetical protein C1941_00995 [Prosthecochloris sp.]|nr:hypothetical protein [Prosthecochloris sp.]
MSSFLLIMDSMSAAFLSRHSRVFSPVIPVPDTGIHSCPHTHVDAGSPCVLSFFITRGEI